MKINKFLGHGYFPEEILPVFTTEDLGKIANKLLKDIDLLDPLEKKGYKSKLMPFSIPKLKGYRRNLSIPNPLYYLRLCNTITENWDNIVAHTDQSTLSLSKLEVRPKTARFLAKRNFDEYIYERIVRSTGNRYLLKIDISRCYNSIYTHSIPWALHTKKKSKASYKRKAIFGNALDEDSRKMQDNQTIGIPTGPDSSRVISEIILSAIDIELKKKMPGLAGVRVIDDFYLYFKTLGEVEVARVHVHKILKEYELELNASKESIIELPETIERPWFGALKAVRFDNDWHNQRKQLITFFDLAILLARKYPDELVLSYAISKIKPTVFHDDNLKLLQSLLLNALNVEPKIINYLSAILVGYHIAGRKLDLLQIKLTIEEFILLHNSLENDYEVAWALWLMKLFGQRISNGVASKLSLNMNPTVILVALDLKESGLVPTGLDTKRWKALLNAENLYSEYWMVAYEVKVQGWLKTTSDYVTEDPFFSLLQEEGVRFYKPEKTLDISKIRVASPSYFDESQHVTPAIRTIFPHKFLKPVDFEPLKTKEDLKDLPFG
jgi:hypothetical protein